MVWDPFGTLRQALWIGGGQWAGKSTVAPDRMLIMVPTERFRAHQVEHLARAAAIGVPGLSDPERAQRNRLVRDRILAADAVDSARRHGIRVIEVDGSPGEEQVADVVADHFGAYLHP